MERAKLGRPGFNALLLLVMLSKLSSFRNTKFGPIASIASVALIVSVSLSSCSSVFYQPSRHTYIDPQRAGLAHEDIWFTASDGVKLHGWYFPAKLKAGEKAKGTIVQFHGNAQNISAHFASLVWVIEAGYNFFTFDYRTYGRSEGDKASQEAVNLDAVAAIHEIHKKNTAIEGKRDLVLYGQSLGGAVLLRALEDIPDHSRIRAVVIEGSFHSYQSIARGKLAQIWLTFLFQPLAWILISDSYSPEDSIPKISPLPLLVIHGDDDQVIPYSYGQKIFQLAREPKTFWTVPHGQHIDSMFREKGKYRKQFLEYLTELDK